MEAKVASQDATLNQTNDRFNRLQTSLDGSLNQINDRFNRLQTALEERTLPLNSLTWKVIIVLGVALIAVTTSALGGFTWYHATKIASAEKSVADVKSNLEGEISKSKESSTLEIGNLKNEFNGRLDSLHLELQEFVKLFIKTPADVVSTTKRAVSAPRNRLSITLPTARKILAVAKEKSIPLPGPEIQALAEPLLRTKDPDASLAREIQTTLSAFASYKTYSDNKSREFPQHLIDKAKITNNYFEKREIVLGEREVWTDTIFKDCEIVTGGGSAKLSLQNVSFVNCTFRQSVAQDIAGERLAKAIIQASQPSISVVLYDFPVGNNKSGS